MARLFAAQPDLEPLFGKDVNDSVKGEMLAQVFDTIFDFIGDRVYADVFLDAGSPGQRRGWCVRATLFRKRPLCLQQSGKFSFSETRLFKWCATQLVSVSK